MSSDMYRRLRKCAADSEDNLQGATYGEIIKRVIEASREDFETGGIDQQTLNDLREVGWQSCLVLFTTSGIV